MMARAILEAMHTAIVTHREELLERAYEQALCSAFAQGVQLTGFQFDLPQADDVLTFPDGTLALRMDTEHHSYSPEELAQHTAYADHAKEIAIPPAFADDTETILELHLADLAEIARGITRDARIGRATAVTPNAFHTFARASLRFHEALLHATAALSSLSQPETAATLMRGDVSPLGERLPSLTEKLFAADEALRMAVRRTQHSHLVHVIETGSHAQLESFFTHGRDLEIEPAFFSYHLERG